MPRLSGVCDSCEKKRDGLLEYLIPSTAQSLWLCGKCYEQLMIDLNTEDPF